MKVWTDTTLGEEIRLAYGRSLPAPARRPGSVPVFGSNGIVGHHDEPAVSGPGIVVGRKGSVGEVAYSTKSFWPIDTTYYVVNPKDHQWKFLFYLLSDLRLNTLNSHSAVPGLNREDVYSIAAKFPDSDEQTTIAAVLDQLADAVAVEDTLLSNVVDLKRAVMRELFTRGLRGEETKETTVGPIPTDWNTQPLGSIADIVYGAQAAVANSLDPATGTLILTNINIGTDGTIDLSKRRYYAVPEKQRDRLILRSGDVLFNWRSGSSSHVGKTAYFNLTEECTFSSFILRFRPHSEVSSRFLFRYLSLLRSRDFFSNQRNVSSINSVFNASLSATIPIWYPKPSDQEKIVEILDAIDQKIDLHKRKKAVFEELFKALLHKLMTGKIRVADLDLSALEGAAPAEAQV